MIGLTKLTPAAVGALLGGIVGLLLLFIPFPQLLLILLFAALGYAIGKLVESEELRAKMRDFFALFFKRE